MIATNRIWHKEAISIADLNAFGKGNMCEHLGIEFTELGANYLVAKMPVDHRTKQPFGLLHGGASVVLAESVASMASALVVDLDLASCVGIEINANHIRAMRTGYVFGKCTPLHLGATTHVWNIQITNERNQLVCISRLTVSVLRKKS